MLGVFVTPWLDERIENIVRLATELPSVSLALICPKNAGALSRSLRNRLVANERVRDVQDIKDLSAGLGLIEKSAGNVGRVFAEAEQLQVPMAELRGRFGIPGLDRATALKFRDKAMMKRLWCSAGLPIAKFALATTAISAIKAADEIGYPLVIKPRLGVRAKNTFLVSSAAELRRALERIRPVRGAEAILEEFINGEEHSCDCVTVRGRPLWQSIVKYSPTQLQANLNPSIQWSALLSREITDSQYADVRKLAANAISALGLSTGYTHMEWFRTSDRRIVLSEIAARPPGAEIATLLSQAHDFSFMKEWTRLSLFDEGCYLPPRKYAVR
jgi:biotin carboxylase